MFMNTSIEIETQPWFIAIDILQIISTSFSIFLSLLFLLIIRFDKTCHSVPMLLVANSCLVEFLLSIDTFGVGIFALRNDLKQIYFSDTLCFLSGYTIYLSFMIQNYSYLLQAIYRYITIVYPARLFWQSAKFQIFLISITWICGIIYTVVLILTKQLKYHVDDQICQIPLELSFITIFNVLYLYLIPVGSIMLIYLKMVRYVREMSQRVTPINRLFHAQRELRMIQRILALVIILLAVGFPYAIFILMSFFNRAPKYHFRIAFLFGDVSVAFVMIAIFQITEPLKASIMKRINGRTSTIAPTTIT